MLQMSLIILLIISWTMLIPIGMLWVECIFACLPDKDSQDQLISSQKLRPKIAVLIPAHNEESGIKATIETLLPQLTKEDFLVVIADNCTDETAAISRQLGVTVIERKDAQRRGKGYALDYGLKFLEKEPPEVVIMIDADCFVLPGTIDRIARLAIVTQRPIQGNYLIKKTANFLAEDAISALGVIVKNLVRLQGLNRLGLPCLLTGTGMAFPWSIISKVSLANDNLVEDLQLGIDLVIRGYSPLFCQRAKVISPLPQEKQTAIIQKTRWQHGYLGTLLKQLPLLLKSSISQRRLDLLAMALDLSILPLSLLVLTWTVLTGVSLLFGFLQKSWTPTIISMTEGLMILSAITAAWLKFGKEEIPGRYVLEIPFYILSKIPIYLSFLTRPQTEWIRTKRNNIDS